jgi:hypothetical protein
MLSMKYKLAASLSLVIASITVCAADVLADAPVKTPATMQSASSLPHADFCFISGAPPSNAPYSKIKNLRFGKQTYGSARQLLGTLAEKASAVGADAIINYSGAQRFGFFPWRMVRPVVSGTAIKWQQSKPDCKSVGGWTLEEGMEMDNAPRS